MRTILDETQLERDQELATYSGRTLKEIQSLTIGAPESLRIYDDREATGDLSDLYAAYPLMDEVHYLRTLAAYTVTRRAAYVRQLCEHVPMEGAMVADFGCGVGSHGLHCLQMGASVDFIDVPGPLRSYAEFRAVRRGFAPMEDHRFNDPCLAPEPWTPYDAVLCLDVLEHVEDPVGVLEYLHGDLRQGGVLALEVSTMHKPTSGHFRSSIDKWIAGGPALLREGFDHLGGVCYAKR